MYIAAGVAPDIALNSDATATLGLSGSIALGDATGSFRFNDATFSASIAITRGAFSFGPSIGYSYADDRVNPDNSEVWGGLSLSFGR